MSAAMPAVNGESLSPGNAGACEKTGACPQGSAGPGSGSPGFKPRPAISPRLRRLLHSLVIHFPIAFLLSATCFSLLYLLTRVKSFQDTARHCLGGGVLFIPLAIWTGLITEKVYLPKPPPAARMEKILSLMLLAGGLAAFIWSLAMPDILDHLQGWNLLYLLLIVALTPLVTIISYFGGMLTFPLE